MLKVLNYYHVNRTIPDGAIYVGRGQPQKDLPDSKYKNPFKANHKLKGNERLQNRDDVIQRYRRYLFECIQDGRITLEELASLRHYDFVCFCHPLPCHADVLVSAVKYACTKLGIELLNDLENEDENYSI